jgi:DNA-binding response OmpR family regulator
MPDERKILVVDDEPRMVQLISMNLKLEGFNVISASGGYEALEKVTREMLDGFETLKKIRELSSIPVIFLSVKGEEHDRVRGLDLGADDYITKPFGPRELVSRINAVLRRTEPENPNRKAEIIIDDELKINFDQRRVWVRGENIKLRPTEYRLLYQLVSNPGKLLTHETLLSRVWGPEYRDEDQYVRLYITYLRQKIERDPKKPVYILSERGMGYRFKEFQAA